MIEPVKAAVRPRVFAGPARGVVLLADLVSELASSNDAQGIELFSEPTAGTTTALRDIAFHFGTVPRLFLADLDRPAIQYEQLPAGLIVFRRTEPREIPILIKCTLAGWSRDEWIEYLLAVHKPRCASVMKRMQHDAEIARLGGNPNILRQVMDELAADEDAPDVRSALIRIVEKQFPNITQRHATGRRIFHRLFRRGDRHRTTEKILSPDLSNEQLRILYIPAILDMLGAEAAWRELTGHTGDCSFPIDWTRELIAAVAPMVAKAFQVQTKLHLSLANLKGAKLAGCKFQSADLSGADLRGASFENCTFVTSQLQEADFRYANLTDANLSHRDLTIADFRYAIFRSANLEACHLEEMELPECDFRCASLQSTIMSGSTMPGANFANANLRFARLAGVEWESVDLRNADLTGATFHMGSSRCGLVDSPFPLEGSRTGFYSDEWKAQEFKSPEEIRLANLRGADLRDACIDRVDFYLVDLRDALYDMDQEDQLRRTGAILETRIC